MTIDEILNAGGYVIASYIDFKNTRVGVLTADGPQLTPQGEKLLKDSFAPQTTQEPAVKTRRKRATAEVAEPGETPEPAASSLDAGLFSLQGND